MTATGRSLKIHFLKKMTILFRYLYNTRLHSLARQHLLRENKEHQLPEDQRRQGIIMPNTRPGHSVGDGVEGNILVSRRIKMSWDLSLDKSCEQQLHSKRPRSGFTDVWLGQVGWDQDKGAYMQNSSAEMHTHNSGLRLRRFCRTS